MDGTGRRGCNGVARNGWGEEAAGDERPWLRGRLTENGCGELRGRRECNGVAGNGWGEEAAGDERAWLRGRCRRQMGAENCVDGVGATEWLEIGGGKKPLVMGDLGCAGGCGRHMGAENCADGCGWRECNGGAGNGSGEEAAGDERAWLHGRLRTGKIGAENCADSCGRRGSKGVARNGWGEEAADDERPWLRERLRTASGCGEPRGVDGCRRRGATEWLEMDEEKKLLLMRDLGCADG